PKNQGASEIKPGAPAPPGQALPGTLKDLVLDGKLEVGVFTLAGISGSGVFQVKTLDKNLTFSGSLRAAADNLKNSLEKLGIAVDTREPGALGAARLELSFTGSTQAVEIKSIALALDDSKLKGSAGVQFSQPPRYSFQLAADVLNADRYLPPKNQGASEIKPGAPAPPGQALPGTLKDLVLDGKLEVGVFTLAGISGSVVFQVKTLDKNLTFSGSLRAAADNLKNSLEKLGIAVDTREPGTLGAARLELSFTGSTQAVEIKPIALALDDTHLKGSARVLLSHPPRYTFLLAADVLDADRYLPPKDTRAPEHKPAKQPPPSQADLSALKNLFLDGKLEVGAVTLAGMDMKDVLVQVMAKNGVLTIEPARSNLYGGSTLAQAGLDVTGKSPRLQVKDEIKLVQLGPLLSDLAGKGFLTGLGTVRTDLTAEGLDTPDILRTLNGTLALGVSDGTVKGVNLPGLIRESWAALKGVPLDQQAVRDTDFAKLTGTVHFAGGQAKSDDLLLITPLLRVSGRGAADLLQRSLDYTLSAAVLGDLRVTVAGVEKNLKNIQIPIRVTGTLDQPKFGIDPVELARQVAGQEIQEKKGEAVKRLEDAIQKNLPPILQQDAGKKARSLLDTLVP
ncbi:MAG: AsmA family protein, partial [Pseudomonadota bacterium]